MNASEALGRERVRMATWAHALFAVLVAYVTYQSISQHVWWLPFALAAVWLTFMTLRTVVTPSHVHVQLGVFGPRIAIDSIVEANGVDGASFVTLAWGIRFSPDGGISYSVPAFGRKYLRVVYVRKNKRRVVRVMSNDPEMLVRAIQRAKTMRGLGQRIAVSGPRARVEGSVTGLDQDRAPLEAEVWSETPGTGSKAAEK